MAKRARLSPEDLTTVHKEVQQRLDALRREGAAVKTWITSLLDRLTPLLFNSSRGVTDRTFRSYLLEAVKEIDYVQEIIQAKKNAKAMKKRRHSGAKRKARSHREADPSAAAADDEDGGNEDGDGAGAGSSESSSSASGGKDGSSSSSSSSSAKRPRVQEVHDEVAFQMRRVRSKEREIAVLEGQLLQLESKNQQLEEHCTLLHQRNQRLSDALGSGDSQPVVQQLQQDIRHKDSQIHGLLALGSDLQATRQALADSREVAETLRRQLEVAVQQRDLLAQENRELGARIGTMADQIRHMHRLGLDVEQERDRLREALNQQDRDF